MREERREWLIGNWKSREQREENERQDSKTTTNSGGAQVKDDDASPNKRWVIFYFRRKVYRRTTKLALFEYRAINITVTFLSLLLPPVKTSATSRRWEDRGCISTGTHVSSICQVYRWIYGRRKREKIHILCTWLTSISGGFSHNRVRQG